MAAPNMDVIKDIPGYKVILKAVLKTQIQQLVRQLAEQTDEESVILTANVSDGTISHLGSENGKMFLETYDDVKKTFLGFCLRRHHDEISEAHQTSDTASVSEVKQKSSSNSNATKVHSKVLPKSRHSPYHSSRPHSNTSSRSKTGPSGIIPKTKGELESKEDLSSHFESEHAHSNAEDYMGVRVKQEPEDAADESSKSSFEKATNDKQKYSDETVMSLSEKQQIAQISGVKLKLKEDCDPSLDWADYSALQTESSGQWADNSNLMTDATELAGYHGTYQEQKADTGQTSDDTDETQIAKNGDNFRDKASPRISDDVGNATMPTLREQIEYPSNTNGSDTSDTDVYDDHCSRDDSLKDYLSEDESKLNMTNSDTDIEIGSTGPQVPPVENSSGEKVLDVINNTNHIAKNVDVMQVCHQTVDKMTHCVARAISEERKQTVVDLKHSSNLPSKDHSRSPEYINNSNNEISNDEMANLDIINENALTHTCQVVDQRSETCDDDLREKSFKVLAIWNEIANDSNEASSEVLYDLIADKLKQKLEKQTSVERQSREENKIKASDVCGTEIESVQTQIPVKDNNTGTCSGKRTDRHIKECSEESVQTQQHMFDRKSREGSMLSNLRDTPDGSNQENRSRQNSGTQTNEILTGIEQANVSENVITEPSPFVNDLPNVPNVAAKPFKDVETGHISNISKNTSKECQHDNKRHATTGDNRNMFDFPSRGDADNGKNINELQHEAKTHAINKKASPPGIITGAATQNTKALDSKGNDIRIPVKQIEIKQTSGITPKQLKSPQTNASKSKQKVQPVTKNTPSKSFIDNLISKGVPIIIPDDDEEEEVNEKDDFMPSPRSTAFEIKSKQYHEETEIKSKRISHVNRSFSTYSPQTHSQMTQNAMQQPYSQYAPNVQQQYQYQDYYDQHQYGNQQVNTQEFSSPKHSSHLYKQQLFTPPKNVTSSMKTFGASPKATQMKSQYSPLRDLSPPSHNFSPPTTPTTPKGSPYLKQTYTTPIKPQPNVQRHQPRMHVAKPSIQKAIVQQQNRTTLVVKPTIPSGTTIVIDDDPVVATRKESQAVVTPQQNQLQPYIVKQPTFIQSQQQQSVQRPVVQPVSTGHQIPVSVHEQSAQSHNISSSNIKSLQASMALPVISNVESVSGLDSDTNIDVQLQQAKHTPLLTRTVSATQDADPVLIRRTNERTPVKRTRSDDTMISPGQFVSEPLVKRRHTSADDCAGSRLSSDILLEVPLKSHLGQGNSEGQVSPSKIPPKLEIDIDDVPGVLQEPGNQIAGLKSPPALPQTNTKLKEERPIIPMSPQLAKSDLTSFSPPVSPSTRRLHAAPSTRSKTPVGMPGSISASDNDNASVTSQENVQQPMKKFGCGDCGKSYTTKAALNQHFRKHTQERPFECDVCGKHYSQKGYLKKHILTHFETQEK